MNKRDFAIAYAKNWLGSWYKWGGDDPSGMDCSGFMIEILKAVGLFPRKRDATAAGLYTMFKHHAVKHPYRGCLVFWHNSNGKIIHVEMLVNTELAIGASGGGSSTTTVEAAIKHNAFIKIRPYTSRSGVAGFVDPFKSN